MMSVHMSKLRLSHFLKNNNQKEKIAGLPRLALGTNILNSH